MLLLQIQNGVDLKSGLLNDELKKLKEKLFQ
jgi:hypothetical protein